MDTSVNNGNSGGNSVGTQTGSTGSNPDDVNDALSQLQATVSDFAQEAQAGTESLIALVNQMGQQLQATDSKVQQNATLIDRLSSWIANYRN
jgi:ABC-type transporter Mla subunit MlaD